MAQMGARVNGIHEVTGSIPVWSTISNLMIFSDLRSDPSRRVERIADLKPDSY